MFNKVYVLLVCIGWISSSSCCFSKSFVIYNNGEPLEAQLTRIVTEINSLPGTEPVTVRFEGGVYRISTPIEIEVGSHYISFVGSRKQATVISGSVPINGWEVLPDGLWRVKLPQIVGKGILPDQLFVNGRRATRSRTPNDNFFVLEDGIKEGTIYGAVLNKEDFNRIGHIMEDDAPILSLYRKWTASKRIVTEWSEKKNVLFFGGDAFPSYNPLIEGNGLIIENTKSGIDTPGEWCVDRRGNIYYFPNAGELVDETVFHIPVVERLIRIRSANGHQGGCSFKNIVFEHTSFPITHQGVEFGQAASRMSAAIEVDNVTGFAIKECEIRNIANYAIWVRENCHKAVVSNTYLHDLGAGAIKIGTIAQVDSNKLTNHVVIDNNWVYKYGMLMENAVGIIVFNASDCSITHNDIHYGEYTGISLGWVWGYGFSPSKRNEVAYNRISHIGTKKLNDLAGIYTLGKSEGTHIHNNIITDVYSGDFRGWGIYADEGTTGIIVDRNIVSRSTSGGYHQHYGSNNVVTNNIFAWGEKSQLTLSSAKEDNPLVLSNNIFIMEKGYLMSGGGLNSTSILIKDNCYWTVSADVPQVLNKDLHTWIKSRDTTSIILDPSFINPVGDDFRINNKSVCKKIGFKEFNTSKVGVYGKRRWRELVRTINQGL